MMKNLVYSIFILFLFLSCSDDDSSKNTFVENKKIPVSVTNANIGTDSYEYDSQRRLTKLVSERHYFESPNTKWFTTTSITYDSQNKVSLIKLKYSTQTGGVETSVVDNTSTPSYSEGKITLAQVYTDGQDVTKENVDYIFDSKNRLVQIMYLSENVVTSLEYDVKGNLLKRSSPYTTYEYTYDDKSVGISNNINAEFWLLDFIERNHGPLLPFYFTFINNAKTEMTTYHDEPVLTTNATIGYTYDKNGVPLSLVFKSEDYNETPYILEYK